MDYSLHINKKYLEDLIEILKAGQVVENNKIDLKRQWHNLSDNNEQNEFAKDVCAIANTFGLDGCIIIGISESGEIINSPVNSSGLSDSAKIMQLLVKRTSHAPVIEISEINIEDKIISLVKIPPSLDKPHFVKNHKNREHAIFVRKGTLTTIANKSDIDLMYYDRKNIEPDYNAIIEIFSMNDFSFYQSDKKDRNSPLRLNLKVYIQNVGRRPVAFNKCSLIFLGIEKDDSLINPIFSLKLKEYSNNSQQNSCGDINVLNTPLLIKANDASFIAFDFEIIPKGHNSQDAISGYLETYRFSTQLILSTVRDEVFKSNEFIFNRH